MLGEHFFDIDIGNDRGILLQRSDIDLVRSAGRIDGAQLLIADQVDGVSDGRIVSDTALEFLAFGAAEDFTQQVDRGAGDVIVGGRKILARNLGYHGDDRGVRAADADEAADGRPNLGQAHARRHQTHPGERAAH